jgi:hypothetical protein
MQNTHTHTHTHTKTDLHTRKQNGPFSHIVEKKITKLFKEMQMKIKFETKNTKHGKKTHPQTDRYKKKGVYPTESMDKKGKVVPVLN